MKTPAPPFPYSPGSLPHVLFSWDQGGGAGQSLPACTPPSKPSWQLQSAQPRLVPVVSRAPVPLPPSTWRASSQTLLKTLLGGAGGRKEGTRRMGRGCDCFYQFTGGRFSFKSGQSQALEVALRDERLGISPPFRSPCNGPATQDAPHHRQTLTSSSTKSPGEKMNHL